MEGIHGALEKKQQNVKVKKTAKRNKLSENII